MNKIVIDPIKCINCCDCIDVCREKVLGINNGVVDVVDFNSCSYCEDCCDICERNAIEVIYDSEM